MAFFKVQDKLFEVKAEIIGERHFITVFHDKEQVLWASGTKDRYKGEIYTPEKVHSIQFTDDELFVHNKWLLLYLFPEEIDYKTFNVPKYWSWLEDAQPGMIDNYLKGELGPHILPGGLSYHMLRNFPESFNTKTFDWGDLRSVEFLLSEHKGFFDSKRFRWDRGDHLRCLLKIAPAFFDINKLPWDEFGNDTLFFEAYGNVSPNDYQKFFIRLMIYAVPDQIKEYKPAWDLYGDFLYQEKPEWQDDKIWEPKWEKLEVEYVDPIQEELRREIKTSFRIVNILTTVSICFIIFAILVVYLHYYG